MTPDELIAFEADVAARFNNKEIPFPIHLSGGNAHQLIEIFRHHTPKDWVFSTWRNHWHALLAGIPPEEVMRQIMVGRSMTVCSPEHRFFSSAIVAGCCPIALGVAWEIKQRQDKTTRSVMDEKVFCFLGDMAALTGMAQECINYARWNELPITFIVEDNGKSVCTDTAKTCGPLFTNQNEYYDYKIKYYKYDLTAHWPHAGSGKRIEF